MFKILYVLFLFFSPLNNGSEHIENEILEEERSVALCLDYELNVLEAIINDPNLSREALSWAYNGYLNLIHQNQIENDSILTVIDFTQISSNKRAYIIDVKNKELLYQKRVAHGMKTGSEYAEHFSNKSGSHQSCFGMFITTSTYHGKYDLALRLEGIEYSNSNASARGIVIHAANYADGTFLEKNGRLGRSFGCPALPHEEFEEIINLIKGRSSFYIYYPNERYREKSKLINLPKTLDFL